MTIPNSSKRIRQWESRIGLSLVAIIVALFFAFGITAYLQGIRPVSGNAQYVALGSSFASGPGLLPRAGGSPLLCARSAENYPHQLARKLGLTLADMTCAGATTHDLLFGGQYFQGPQIAAISPSTRLVTITVGGNDVRYLSNLIALSCSAHHSFADALLKACVITTQEDIDNHLSKLEASLLTLVETIRAKSQTTQIVFVSYLNVLPKTGTCDALALSVSDADAMREVANHLQEITRQAAMASGSKFVDPNISDADHGVCSSKPWVNRRFPEKLLTAPLHPNAEGMAATTAAIFDVLVPVKHG